MTDKPSSDFCSDVSSFLAALQPQGEWVEGSDPEQAAELTRMADALEDEAERLRAKSRFLAGYRRTPFHEKGAR